MNRLTNEYGKYDSEHEIKKEFNKYVNKFFWNSFDSKLFSNSNYVHSRLEEEHDKIIKEIDDNNEQYNDKYVDFYSKLRKPENVECIKVNKCRKVIKKIKVKKCRKAKAESIYKILSVFDEKIRSELPKELLERYNHNIVSLTIELDEKNEKNVDYSGKYTAYKNQIIINDLRSLKHELLHMASSLLTPKKDGIYDHEYLGFRDHSYGLGLNEGYTQLLTKRYFSNVLNSYILLSKITSRIEYIIGETKMISLYFTTGLKGLIDELIKYDNSIESIFEFVKNSDTLKDDICDKSKISRLKSIYPLIIHTYSNKLYNDVLSGKDIDCALNELESFYEDIITKDFDSLSCDKEELFKTLENCYGEAKDYLYQKYNESVNNKTRLYA